MCVCVCVCVDSVLLRACDNMRDHRLGELGVRMEDKEEGTVVKMVGKEAIERERELERKVCTCLAERV